MLPGGLRRRYLYFPDDLYEWAASQGAHAGLSWAAYVRTLVQADRTRALAREGRTLSTTAPPATTRS